MSAAINTASASNNSCSMRLLWYCLLMVMVIVCYGWIQSANIDLVLSLRTKPHASKPTAQKTYKVFDGKRTGKHWGIMNSSQWLIHSPRVEKIVEDIQDADVIVYETVGDDTNIIPKDIQTLQAMKSPHAVILLLIQCDFLYVPNYCAKNDRTVYLVPKLNANSNCTQIQIPYYYGLKNYFPHIAQRHKDYLLSKDYTLQEKIQLVWNLNGTTRDILAGFVGSSWTYKPRQLLSYFNKYSDCQVVFNDKFWSSIGKNKNETYAAQSMTQSKKMFERMVFTLAPRGNGISSMRFIEAIGYGTLPVLMDDETKPFGDPIDFAIRFSFPKQNFSEPPTNATILAFEKLYAQLKHIQSNPSVLHKLREKMMKFFIEVLAKDISDPSITYTQMQGLFPRMPFSSYLFEQVDRIMGILKN